MLLEYIPIFLVIAIAIIFATMSVAASKMFGPQCPSEEKLSTYESGMKPIGTTKERISVKYYMVGMFFIIFDLEVIYVYPWAVEFKKMYAENGVSVFVSMVIFLVVLEIGYLYAYKKGGFKWD